MRLGCVGLRRQADFVAAPLGTPPPVIVAVGAHRVAMDAERMAFVVVTALKLALAVVISFGGTDIHHA